MDEIMDKKTIEIEGLAEEEAMAMPPRWAVGSIIEKGFGVTEMRLEYHEPCRVADETPESISFERLVASTKIEGRHADMVIIDDKISDKPTLKELMSRGISLMEARAICYEPLSATQDDINRKYRKPTQQKKEIKMKMTKEEMKTAKRAIKKREATARLEHAISVIQQHKAYVSDAKRNAKQAKEDLKAAKEAQKKALAKLEK